MRWTACGGGGGWLVGEAWGWPPTEDMRCWYGLGGWAKPVDCLATGGGGPIGVGGCEGCRLKSAGWGCEATTGLACACGGPKCCWLCAEVGVGVECVDWERWCM